MAEVVKTAAIWDAAAFKARPFLWSKYIQWCRHIFFPPILFFGQRRLNPSHGTSLRNRDRKALAKTLETEYERVAQRDPTKPSARVHP